MGVPDTSLLDLNGKDKTLLSRSGSDYSSQMAEINMDENMFGICSDCELKFIELSHKFFCRGCGRTFCSTCICRSGSLVIIAASDSVVKGCVLKNIIKSCKFCIRASKRRIEKIYPSESPRESPEPPSPCSGREKVMNGRDAEATIETDHVYDDPAGAEHDISIYAVSNNNTISSIPNHLPPISVCGSQICATEDCRKYMFEPSRDHCHDSSDVDSCSVVSLRHECCSCKSSDSSPADSPSRINISYPRVGDSVHHEKEGSLTSHVDGTFDHRRVLLVKPERRTTNPANSKSGADHLSILQSLEEKYQQPLDFENNDNLWFPPPPEHEDDETGGNFFEYDDDDDEIGESRGVFSSSGDLSSLCSVNEKQSDVPEEPLSSAVHSHFRALVSQLLQGEDIKVTNENESEDWLGVVSNLAWLAAKSVKPDTKKGGSMDPGDYIKIKCLASGKPSQSTLVKGVVCTKNIKHKRMTSQYKNPRLLLLGGSLEYARVPNQLASFSTIFEEESDQLKLIVSRIEAHHTNVLLVEKSVSPIAQEYLLDKDISLVLNVKRTLLDRIARCTGASITPSVDNIKSSSLGHCEHFRLEKVFEELEATKQPNKRPSKTLMFFEGCPRRLGCTILLKGSYREELKKIKKVIQYAVFAAYHLSLETSFLADEGASLPKMTLQPLSFVPEHTSIGNLIPAIANSALDDGLESSTEHLISVSASMGRDDGPKVIASEGYVDGSVSDSAGGSCFMEGYEDTLVLPASEVVNIACSESPESPMVEALQHEELERVGEREVSADYFSAQESSQSLLVSFSSRCVLKGTVCERSRLLRIKFYGSFDKPLGRYLRDDLFDQASYCRSCKEPIESHVQCYTHQQGSLTINVRRMAAKKLPGQQDGKIWMWHRCLRCAQVDGYPPATHRVVMSDAAWGLSFGKFLELSFSNHTTANRIASCGHSMQRDCLRFYGCGDMVAFFHYSPIKILSVRLPPSVLEFDGLSKQQWLKKEATELKSKMETLYLEMADILHDIEQKGVLSANGFSDLKDFSKHIVGLKDLLDKEKDEYYVLLHEDDKETPQSVQNDVDILELNSLRHSLLLASRVWEHRFYCLDSLLKSGSSAAALLEAPWSLSEDTESDGDRPVENAELLETEQSSLSYISSPLGDPNLEFNVSENYNLDSRSQEEISKGNEVMEHEESFERSASSISDKIDSAWIGTYLQPVKSHATHLQSEAPPRAENLPVKRLIAPARVYSFDSATRLRERFHKASYPSSLRVRSFHATGEHKSMARDPAFDVLRTYSQIPPHEIQRLSSGLGSPASYISSAAQVTEGARLLLPQMARSNLVIAVYDDEPTSLISYALSSNEHEDWVSNKLNGHERSLSVSDMNGDEFSASSISPWQSLGSADLDYMGSEDLLSPKISSFFYGAKKSPHLRVSFEDDSSSTMGKAKFSVTCYFAKQFEMLRRKCCPSEVDIVSSLSRCKKWSAQGGKSNVYFAKSLDERFIVKQVSKTELESFGEFASEYFRYLNESLSSRSPTCLAKVLGIYQVSVRNMRGGKETKMDVMVMENLFFKKSVSRIYDLKGSSRSRYNADTSGKNNVLLDMNLLETLRTDPIFLGSKAKRSLERAIWNDTAFLASVDVMDYSLLVGVDEEKRELVVGIIDYMRQYTWDKHLETWVKASGILGGPKNASPTIVSPMQYKKRFRKAMTTYFLTVPDQLLS